MKGDIKPLLLLLADLEQERGDLDLHVYIADEGLTGDRKPLRRFLRRRAWKVLEAEQSAWEAALRDRYEVVFRLQPGLALAPNFFGRALATWRTLPEPAILSVLGERRRKQAGPSDPEPISRVRVAGGWFLAPPQHEGLPIYRTLNSLVDAVAEPEPEPLPVRPDLSPEPEEAQPGQPRMSGRLAAFLVASNHRPLLIRACLDLLHRQEVPGDWQYEIVVCGEDGDPARLLVANYPLARWVTCTSSAVGVKLNLALSETKAELICLADDDDLQPPERLRLAINRFEEGAAWSGSGTCLFYHPEEDRLVRWTGRADRGTLGTSLSFARWLLDLVGGWPPVPRDKDGLLMRRITPLSRARTLRFADLTAELGERLVCLQHGGNLWHRPALEQGEEGSKGGYRLEGLGSGLGNTSIPPATREAMTRLAKAEGSLPDVKIVLASIVLNEAEFIPRSLEQHLDWPGLVQWVFVEGATRIYGARNPDAVTPGGLSTDATGDLLLQASRVSELITYVPFGWADGPEGQQKRTLRNAYCEIADRFDADLLIVVDGDEFYSKADQAKIAQHVLRNPDFDAWIYPQRHLWRPPSIAEQDPMAFEVTGGYWAIPHTRVWRLVKGARYEENHNHLTYPGKQAKQNRVWRPKNGDPECIHLGFARDGEHRARTNAYYVARGEGSEDGFNRQWYVDCRSAWETWTPEDGLPHGAEVVPYEGPVPEVLGI